VTDLPTLQSRLLLCLGCSPEKSPHGETHTETPVKRRKRPEAGKRGGGEAMGNPRRACHFPETLSCFAARGGVGTHPGEICPSRGGRDLMGAGERGAVAVASWEPY